jgi:hypothetical protein
LEAKDNNWASNLDLHLEVLSVLRHALFLPLGLEAAFMEILPPEPSLCKVEVVHSLENISANEKRRKGAKSNAL